MNNETITAIRDAFALSRLALDGQLSPSIAQHQINKAALMLSDDEGGQSSEPALDLLAAAALTITFGQRIAQDIDVARRLEDWSLPDESLSKFYEALHEYHLANDAYQRARVSNG